ncbi:DUF3168 domain-containing protein [Mesobacterium pallidum]|uniref:DUF3168 domain-containing protein n=1 Tax=Mesobacterium pallidum TaxID=2872037 RepID=UPI001EE388C4|nr:DUF3168 domain-containing protein [Mesobacterium pallidum]
MSYGVSAALQAAIYDTLVGDAALSAIVGSDIYDAVPPGTLPSIYVTLGDEIARDRSDKTGDGAEHTFVVSVVTELDGFSRAKQAAAAISDALHGQAPVLSRGRVVSMNFLRAAASREQTGGVRRIDLRFRARVEDD